MIPWHRLFGRILEDLYTGTSYRVEVEKDLSIKQQFLDVAVIEMEERGPGFVGLEDPPDGLDDLGRHNLITFKSFQDTLTPWSMDELLGHFVNYRKQCSPDKEKLAPLSAFRLIAVTARYPRALASEAKFAERCAGVYTMKWGSQDVRVVVLGQVAMVPRNAVWGLFSGKPERVLKGELDYRWKRADTSTVVQLLYRTYRARGVTMPYTAEDFRRDLLDEVVKMYPLDEVMSKYRPEERLKGLRPEERLKGLRPEERLKGLRPEERLKGLTPEQLQELRRLLEASSED